MNPAETRKPRINLTTMVSLMMFLLVTFILLAMSLTKVGRIDASVANGCGCGWGHGHAEAVIVQVSGEGAVFVNKKLHDINELPKLLGAYRECCEKNGQTPRITVTGDDRARYGALVRAVDLAKTAGIAHVNLETNYRDTGK